MCARPMMLLARAGCDRARYAHGGRPVGRTARACECARAGLEGLGAGRQSTVGVVERERRSVSRAAAARLLVVRSACVRALSGPKQETGDGGRVAVAAASDLVSRRRGAP